MVEINRNSAVLIVLAIIVSYPFVTASLLGFIFNRSTTNFSIYNTGWNGVSVFKQKFMDHPNQGKISTIVGSSNILNRLNATEKNNSLIILGPAIHYDFSEALAILMFAINGGRVLIADDFGTSNDILSVLNIFLGLMSQINLGDLGLGGMNLFGMDSGTGSMQGTLNTTQNNVSLNFPIAGIAINGSLLADQGSYYKTPLTPIFHSPETTTQEGTSYQMPAPWVSDFTEGFSGNGVLGNFASIISMKVRYPDRTAEGYPDNLTYITKWVPMSEFPAEVSESYDLEEYNITLPKISFSMQIAVLYSSTEAWLESDINAAKTNVNYIEPDLNEWGNPNIGFPVFVYFPFPLGGQIIICSDPSIFINRYLDTSNPDYNNETLVYDNGKFADNLVAKLMEGRVGQTIIFDEGHLANHPLSPILPLSLYLKLLDMVTMFPLFAWALPIVAIVLSRKFMPKRTQAKPLLLTRVERYYGRSFFAVKMRWFLEYKQYSRGLELIYRRLKRNLSRRYNPDAELTPETITAYLLSEFPDRFDQKKLLDGLVTIENIIETRAPLLEEEFLNHYLFLKSIGIEIS